MTDTLPRTLREAILYFASPDNCRDYLVARRWPNGVTCLSCGSAAVYFDKGRNGWECKTRHPRRKFTLKTGTIFEDSPLPLSKWLPCVWLLSGAKNGISSYEVSRALGVTQKTAWFMLHRIRLAMQCIAGDKFGGHVEVDETFIGGLARNMHKGKRARVMKGKIAGRSHLTAVVGAIKRTSSDGPSQAIARVVPDTRRKSVMPFVNDHVSRENAVLYTERCARTSSRRSIRGRAYGPRPRSLTESSTTRSATWMATSTPTARRISGRS